MTSTLPFLFYWLNRVPKDLGSALDLGAGRGIVGAMLRIYRNPPKLHAIEIHPPYAQFAKQFYDQMTVENAVTAIQKLPDKSYDIVTCFEMIEHLSKEDGLLLIQQMERVGRILFISTPGRWFPQPEYDENVYQLHRSLWTAGEFRRMGFSVRGFGGAQWYIGLGAGILLPGRCDNLFVWKKI